MSSNLLPTNLNFTLPLPPYSPSIGLAIKKWTINCENRSVVCPEKYLLLNLKLRNIVT